jgi:hypothetical protein
LRGIISGLAGVREMGSEGVGGYATWEGGANVHVLCLAPYEPSVAAAIGYFPAVGRIFGDGVGGWPGDAEPLF